MQLPSDFSGSLLSFAASCCNKTNHAPQICHDAGNEKIDGNSSESGGGGGGSGGGGSEGGGGGAGLLHCKQKTLDFVWQHSAYGYGSTILAIVGIILNLLTVFVLVK